MADIKIPHIFVVDHVAESDKLRVGDRLLAVNSVVVMTPEDVTNKPGA